MQGFLKIAHDLNLFDYITLLGHPYGFEPKPAANRTSAMPGSPAKLQVMCERIENGESLFHPDDPVLEKKCSPWIIGERSIVTSEFYVPGAKVVSNE